MRKSLVKQLMEQLSNGLSRKKTAPGSLLSAIRSDQSMAARPRFMLQLLGLTAGLTLSAWGHAVGLGAINVTSSLGQPLKAEIELVAVTKSDKPGLVARLASPDIYQGAGLDYPSNVKYTFQVVNHANGEPYLRLSSNREINDPFVSLLVELSWSSGRLMREYTFLLDPPGYVAEQPKPAAVQTISPAVVQSVPMEEQKPQAASAPVEPSFEKPAATVKRAAPEKPVSASHENRAVRHEQAGSVTVRRGDTLSKIAASNKPDDVSLERMLVALYRANDNQFDGKNMNRIRTGKILRMPQKSDLTDLAQADAVREIHAQAADWNAYRQKLASAASTSRESESRRQVVTGKITSTAADKAPVASESAREVLRLSKGEAPGDKTGAAGKSAQDKLNSAAEEAIAKGKTVREEKTRAALLEKNLKDMQQLARLKSEAAALSTDAASKVPAVSAVPAVSQAASHVAAASAVKPAVVEEPSLWDQLMASPLAMGIGAAALIALGGFGIAIGRRKKRPLIADKHVDEVSGAKTGQLTAPVIPSPDTGDFTAPTIPVEDIPLHPDDVDPISEADLFLNFGRDEQAEEVLKDALQHSPDNHQIHLKLLGIYASRQDNHAFNEIAGLLQNSGDSEAIQQAEALAQKLTPVKPPEASIEDAASATQLTAALDMPEDASAQASVETVAIDFDVTEAAQTPELDFDVTSTSPVTPEMLDFDISAIETEAVETVHHEDEAQPIEVNVPSDEAEIQLHEDEALPNLDDLIFDVMSNPVSDKKAKVGPSAEASDEGMEFTLDFPMDDVAESVAPQAPAIDLSAISLDMDDITGPVDESAGTEKNERWHEVATKLDLAKAYQEMGDDVGAREILDEVMLEGDDTQKQEAQLLIEKLG